MPWVGHPKRNGPKRVPLTPGDEPVCFLGPVLVPPEMFFATFLSFCSKKPLSDALGASQVLSLPSPSRYTGRELLAARCWGAPPMDGAALGGPGQRWGTSGGGL